MNVSRRKFLISSVMVGTAMAASGIPIGEKFTQKTSIKPLNPNPLKIGLMTYLLGSKWDIDTIIKNCTESSFLSVELRTTHAHGIEVTLNHSQREEVKKRFKDSAIETISLASALQYHSPAPDIHSRGHVNWST